MGDYKKRIIHRELWQPYGWYSQPLNNLSAVYAGKMKFSFLCPQPKGKGIKRSLRPPESIVLDNGGEDIIALTLPYVCLALHRDRSSFFKMLYMYTLRDLGLVDKEFVLIRNFKKRLERLQE